MLVSSGSGGVSEDRDGAAISKGCLGVIQGKMQISISEKNTDPNTLFFQKLILRPKSLWRTVLKASRRANCCVGRVGRFVVMPEMENAVTFVTLGAECANLMQNHPPGSYKHNRITRRHSGSVQTPTGPLWTNPVHSA